MSLNCVGADEASKGTVSLNVKLRCDVLMFDLLPSVLPTAKIAFWAYTGLDDPNVDIPRDGEPR